MKTASFSYSEEAFLLNSLHKVVKVWASGNGKADFILKIQNGTADLQLAFKLGRPYDVHVNPHPQHNPQPPQGDLHQELPRPRRHKGPARREKDRVRAEKHQASLKSKKTAESADILLPFHGRILPLIDDQTPVSTSVTASVAPSPSLSPPPSTRESSAASALTPTGAETAPVAKPKKPSISISSPKYIDYNLVRKNLFPLQPPPTQDTPGQEDPRSAPERSKEFQKKEDDLWSRIFSKS